MAVTLHTYAVAPFTLTVASIAEEDDDDSLDPCFFDEGYSLAAQTAYSVWEGAAFLLAFLQRTDCAVASDLRRILAIGEHKSTARRRVLELGSGTGAAGLGLALLGSDVLLTDVAPVVDLLWTNVQRNATPVTGEEPRDIWHAAVPVGLGSAAAQPLNWTFPLPRQSTPNDPRAAQILLATETTWLQELVSPFVSTVAALLQHGSSSNVATMETRITDVWSSPVLATLASQSDRKWMLWVYKERGTAKSDTFTTFPSVCHAFAEHQCHVHELYQERGIEDPLPVRVCAVTFGQLDMEVASAGPTSKAAE
ncbi:hypothetical protein AMAG_14576 [Allomyces macrogynus ATCC 38327]|uniref:Uncharacterized protein n=1 Tax=Allomyces macrogynus (strain ATCC 38327) TaxID=578462 RepID=A0A0L0T6V6_ALLM3|nr:hypothetical protein AMAG_14576 [Allomyces macrogynus ATCC 38327]|eukprot:KNE70446.1 hypothetical protein AMAG_14576 [Allomyces macrogynus ATCC 38327]